tara:strand:+ start:9665 stop:10990 length:1326 start_codon:yes stop_codon:yes gene_type:complete
MEYDDLPESVVSRCEDLFLDWLGSALAGKGSTPIPLFERFAEKMGPKNGESEILTLRSTTSPYFAAFVNAASSHVVEQDDVHASSVFHPGAVIFPAVLAASQAEQSSGSQLILAAVAGYEAGIRIGESLGRTHYNVFHTTGTVGTLAAAIAVGKLLNLSEENMRHAIGNAGTQAAGLWEFLRDGADSKQLHTAKAAADGLLSAYMAQDGLTGAKEIIEGQKGMAAGMSTDFNPLKINDGLGERWVIDETSFKFHASCRHTHPAADALQQVIENHALKHSDVESVVCHVHQAAIDVLGQVNIPSSVHQAKFSMGTVLGLIAVHGKAGLEEFERYALNDLSVADFCSRVSMSLDTEVNEAYPAKWLGKVEVFTRSGEVLKGVVCDPKGDPENSLSRSELEQKFDRLVSFSGAATPSEKKNLIDFSWKLHDSDKVGFLVSAPCC